MSPPNRTDPQSGAALITALVIVAVMSIATIAVLDMMRFSYRVAVNTQNRDQARLYLLGAERLAAATLKTARGARSADSYPLLDAWTREPIIFPIDGGQITGRVVDAANCFNVNTVVAVDADGYVKDEESAQRLELLLQMRGFDAQSSSELVSALVDWIDQDSTPGYGGAEDAYYMSLPAPYRTAGGFLADISELKAISGFTPDMVGALSPYLCAYPNVDLHALNVNTIDLWQGPLLRAYLGADFDEQSVVDILAERPVNGFKSIEDFFASPIFVETPLQPDQKEYFALKSSYYTLQAEIRYYDTATALTSTLEVGDSGGSAVLSRRYGAR